MPPNLGGFFMVRSYYPSECHADYFDFERIEALKPAIEACGISTLSQSPMLGFHKQMDTQDAFSRSGWLWPVDAKGEPLKATSYMAVGFYVAKYVNKKSDMDLAAKGLGAKEWNNSLKTKLSLLPKKLFRIRMSRNFG